MRSTDCLHVGFRGTSSNALSAVTSTKYLIRKNKSRASYDGARSRWTSSTYANELFFRGQISFVDTDLELRLGELRPCVTGYLVT